MKRQKCCILMRAQEWDKSKAQEKATTLQGVSPSHLIKFCTVLQSHYSGGDLKHLKQWSRICYSFHFFPLLREDQKALSMGRWEGCGLLAWANWHRKKWGSGRTLYQSVNIRWKQQGCIMLPNSLKQGRQGKRKYHCLATAFSPLQMDCATQQDHDPSTPLQARRQTHQKANAWTLVRFSSGLILKQCHKSSSCSLLFQRSERVIGFLPIGLLGPVGAGEKICLCY